MEQSEATDQRNRSSRGYLAVAGCTLIYVGAMYVLMSAFSAFVAASHENQMNPQAEGFASFGWLADVFEFSPRGLVAIGLLTQVVLGWILGIFTIVAGFKALKGKSLSFVRKVSIANLFYFPIGSTIGVMALLGLKRPSVKAQFRS
ncbi:hypothetical protein [Pelagicoccus sp. SDUM812003]|uniref:hypothetical protein n=1 Tax=Pelagicoccus sp. SDUM812003 TaxID=3041267 RepID=UPI0028103590|nr:hypothetical protein [Pelagicoccus sp. SDUM812003]MDQ8201791.1 hypothetical protein [Pelagicoccus sp. SDUM812003]